MSICQNKNHDYDETYQQRTFLTVFLWSASNRILMLVSSNLVLLRSSVVRVYMKRMIANNDLTNAENNKLPYYSLLNQQNVALRRH